MVNRDLNSVKLVLDYAQTKGIAASELLQDSGIALADLDDLNKQIQAHQELAVVKNLLAKTGDCYQLGIELGSLYQLTSYGLFGYTMIASSTLRKAISFGLDYLGLTYVFSDILITEDEQQFQLTLKPQLDGDLGTTVLLRDIWAVILICADLLPENEVELGLNLTFKRPEYLDDIKLEQLNRQFALGVHFQEADNQVYGDVSVLDIKLSKANEMTALICEQECRKLLDLKKQWQPVSKQVRDVMLSENINASMEWVAERMGRTSRTLHRQLKAENTSWRNLRDLLKMEIAEQLLLQPLSIEQIAEQLGFSDSANFSHSFKRCKGLSPSSYRKKLLA